MEENEAVIIDMEQVSTVKEDRGATGGEYPYIDKIVRLAETDIRCELFLTPG